MSDKLTGEIDRLKQIVEDLYGRGEYDSALRQATRARDLAEKHLGPQDPRFATALNNLAAVHYGLGQHASAEPLYRRALEIRRTVLGESHPTVAIVLANLANLYKAQRDYDRAEPFYTEALELLTKNLGDFHPQVAVALNELAGFYSERGDFPAAVPLLTRARAIWKTLSGFRIDHPEAETTLYLLATALQRVGQYGAAETCYRELLALRCRLRGASHPDVAASLHALAGLCQEVGRYAEAERLLEQVLAIVRQALGNDHPHVAATLHDLGLALAALGRYRNAEPLFRQALEIYRRTLGGRDRHVANCLNSLACYHAELAQYRQAEELYRQALAIWRDALGSEDPEFATGQSNLANLYRDTGRYAEAEKLYQQVLQIRGAALGQNDPLFALSLANFALLYQFMGRYPAAESLYRRALELRQHRLGERHPLVAETLDNMAGLYSAMGDYGQALRHSREAVQIWRDALGEEHPHFATGVHNLGRLYQTIDNFAEAASCYRISVNVIEKTRGELHPHLATSLNSLASLLRLIGQTDQAEQLYRRTLNIRRRSLGELHPEYASTLNNLAIHYVDVGDLERARPLLEQALQIERTVLSKEHPACATTLANLAELLRLRGEYAQAEPVFREALGVARAAFGEEHPDIGKIMVNLALLYAAIDRPAEALDLMSGAAAIDDRLAGQVVSISSEQQRAAHLDGLRASLDAFVSLLLTFSARLSGDIGAGIDLVLRRKAVGAEALAAQRDAIIGGRYPALEPKLRELAALRSQIAQRSLAGPGPEGLAAHRRLLQDWDGRKEWLEIELASQIPEMDLALRLRAANRRAVTGALPPGSALVEFVRFKVYDFRAGPARGDPRWGPSRYAAFVLRAGEPEGISLIDLGEANSIDDLIAGYRGEVTGGRDLATGAGGQGDGRTAGTKLRALVFDRLLPALKGRTRLFFAPDGELSRLPFGALPLHGGRYLIDDYFISYLSTGRDVLRFGATLGGTPAEPLVGAAPDFDLAAPTPLPSAETPASRQSRDLGRDERFDPLEGARAEGEDVARMLDVEPLLGPQVLKGTVRGRHSPRVLHLATHGFFLRNQERDPDRARSGSGAFSSAYGGRLAHVARLENPLLRSGLALAGVNAWLRDGKLRGSAEDGLLTAEDVSGLDLVGTELAVLSACETGLGDIHAGEGVFGLRRAFVLAGAKTLVMSLWKVPDEETRKLMEDFYRRLLADNGRAEALRGAQLAMKTKKPDPVFWGAFICQGDSGPLSGIASQRQREDVTSDPP